MPIKKQKMCLGEKMERPAETEHNGKYVSKRIRKIMGKMMKLRYRTMAQSLSKEMIFEELTDFIESMPEDRAELTEIKVVLE